MRNSKTDIKNQKKEERYQFTWPGKTEAIQQANSPINSNLQPFIKESIGKNGIPGEFDSENLYIQGDNLEVLKILQKTHSGTIKMIYIDPPYNTGNAFVYDDDFSTSDWLNMMYPRLKLAQSLLTEDGTIFISIDEGEIEKLKIICSEIFGEQNFVNTFMWLHGKGKKDSWSRTLQQYIVAYAKDKSKLEPWTEKKICNYDFKNPDNDPKGPWFSGSLSFSEERSNPKSPKYYTIKSPSGIEWTRQWMISKEQMEKLIADGNISFGKAPEYNGVPRIKIRPGASISVIPNNIIEDCNTTRGAENYLSSLFGSKCFSYPKPYELIQKLASFMNLQNATVMDFFSGSATTAESIIRHNLQNPGTNTKFIMVQLPENLDQSLQNASKPSQQIIKNAIKYLDSKKLPHNLCEIGKERIRLAGKKLTEQSAEKIKTVDIGFKSYRLV